MVNNFEEVAGTTHELVEEVCHAIVAVTRAVATLHRLSVRAATFVLAIACLMLAVEGMGLWYGKEGVVKDVCLTDIDHLFGTRCLDLYVAAICLQR